MGSDWFWGFGVIARSASVAKVRDFISAPLDCLGFVWGGVRASIGPSAVLAVRLGAPDYVVLAKLSPIPYLVYVGTLMIST